MHKKDTTKSDHCRTWHSKRDANVSAINVEGGQAKGGPARTHLLGDKYSRSSEIGRMTREKRESVKKKKQRKQRNRRKKSASISR